MNSPYRRAQQRKPQRLTITVPFSTYERIERNATEQGRSLSNLSAYLLERALEELEQ
jgi:hypothetical protein